MSNVVFYPIETTKRELEGVFLVAAKLAARGYKVYIGPKYQLDYHLKKLRPNIYIGTRADETNYGLLKTLRASGCKIAIVDTEGGIMIEEQYKTRHYKPGLAVADLFFAWGAVGANIIKETKTMPDEHVIVSGAPWFDMSDVKPFYKHTVAEIRKKHPNSYFLFNSRLSFPNHKSKHIADSYREQEPEEFAYYEKQYHNLNETLKKLALDFPDETFVIRAHPSEDPSYYYEFFKGIPNISIDDSFSSRAWVLASKLVLHNSCTTGLEAAMLGMPVVAYQEVRVDAFDKTLPNLASISVNTYAALKEKIRYYIDHPAEPYSLNQSQIAAIKNFFNNVDGSGSEIIVKNIAALPTTEFIYKPGADYLGTKRKMDIIYKYPFLLNFLSSSRRNDLLNSKKYFKGKFQSLELEQLQRMLAEFKAAQPQLPPVIVNAYTPLEHTYCIGPA